MYKLKSIAKRGSVLGVAVALLAAIVAPSASVFADALNPLTERSLLLTSSAPGYMESDGSGNTENTLNGAGEYYSPPGSGPNGKKSGETFTFRVSTDSVADNRGIKAMTLQYCTEAAGKCQSPGNNTGDARDPDGAGPLEGNRGSDSLEDKTSDLNVNYTGATLGTEFEIWVDGVEQTTPGEWTLTTANVEDDDYLGDLSGKNNFITLAYTGAGDGLMPEFNDQIRVVFNASTDDYITNPGEGSFFVKINTYDTATTSLHIPTVPQATNPNIIDGGVTVANVMTDSIHITTKVLETMSFSVGTHNTDTDEIVLPATHGTCSPIQAPNDNRLDLGNSNAEFSLETDTTHDVFSYWRLSSNSSGGATVYYSGNTLANTVGDEIQPIGASAQYSTQGTEQFGLAFVDAAAETDATFKAAVLADPDRYSDPALDPLTAIGAYAAGDGDINADTVTTADDAQFAFLSTSSTTPVVIAQDGDDVISCATAKIRYIANIGADTPAGVYTTKINYLAAPQY